MNTINELRTEQQEIRYKLEELQDEINDLQDALSEYDQLDEIDPNEMLIHEDEFRTYIIEMFQDLYDIPEEIVVDWQQTANDQQTNYTSIEINGEVYYYIA